MVFKYIKDFFENIFDWIIKNFILLCNITFCLILGIMLLPGNEKYFITIFSSYLILGFIKYLYKKNNEEGNKIPMIQKRFTKKLRDGTICIKRLEWEEAVIYLYMIEEYLGK